MTDDASLVGAGVLYLQLAALALPFLAGTAMVEAVYAGLGRTRAIMLMAVVVLSVKVPSGAVLIFVWDRGIAGAALSTVLGTIAGCGFLVWWGWHRIPEVVRFSLADVRRCWRRVAPKLWTIGWPETTSLVLASVATVVVIGFVARLGSVDIAAFRIVSGVLSMLFAVTFACSNGVAILVGQRLGAGQLAAARTYQQRGLQLAAMLAAAVSFPLLVAPSVVLGTFSADTEVVELAVVAVWPALAAVPIMVVAMNFAGVLRAAGDTRSTMMALLVSSYGVQIPLAWLLHGSHGVPGVCLAILASWTARLAVTWYRYRRGAWRTSLDLPG